MVATIYNLLCVGGGTQQIVYSMEHITVDLKGSPSSLQELE